MSEIANPYIAGAPVVESSMFFGREDVFKWIERSLAGKYVNHILVLHGQRRVGKTSVLKQIPNFLPKHYIQVFFDLQGRTSTSLDRFLWWLASEIVRTLKKERDIEVPRPDRKAFEDTEYLIGEFLPSLRPLLGEQILILTFDEFDTLDRSEIQEMLARPLITYLRRMMEMDGLNFIFSIGSSGDKLENMQASYTDFFKSALYRKISFLTRDDCHRLITKPVEGIIQYEHKAVERIAEITSGHPYFTQLMCHELFALCQKTGARTISAENVEAILGDVIERGTVNLKFVWDEASDIEKWILAGLAQLDRGATTQKLAQLLQQQRVRFSDADLNSAVIHLRDKDIIAQDNRFVIHLMCMWLLANRPLDRVREELAESNPIANRYIEIGDEYRDRGQVEQAVESYQQALQADPGNLRAQVSIGQVYFDAKNYPQAAAAFELALQGDDEDVGARSGFCNAILAQADAEQDAEQVEAALRLYEKILIVNPAHRDARQRLADIHRQRAEEYLQTGQDDAALSAFNKALDYTPEDDSLSRRYDEILAQKKNLVIAQWMEKAEHAQARQHWDEAAGFVEEALKLDPHNEALRAKLLKAKDAPRQFKIQGYRQEAEQAIKRRNFEKAIDALETALLLSPSDPELTNWLETVRTDQRNIQFLLLEEQIKRDAANRNWDAAIEGIRQAKKIAPREEDWDKKIAEIEQARHQAQLSAYREQAALARQAGRWEDAISALQKYCEMEPGQPEIETEIAGLQQQKRQSEMLALKTAAEKSARAEKWTEAAQAWEQYLKLQPQDAAEAERNLQHARKYGRIAADYLSAQDDIRKKRYGRAIELLQGIIAQDPTYKATSRLLVEAVEANKAVPPWRRGRVWGGLAAAFLLIASIGIGIAWLGQQNFTFPIARKDTPTNTATQMLTPSLTPTPALDPAIQAALDTIQNEEPLYQTSFDDWDTHDTGRNAALVNGKLILTSEDEENGASVRMINHQAANFAIQFDFRFWDAELGVDDYNGGRCIWEFGMMDELDSGEASPPHFVFFAGGGLLYKDVALRYDETKTNTVTVIILADQMTLFLNDTIVFTDPNLGIDKRKMTSFLNAQFPIVCEYDNYKYWDLQEMAPAVKTALHRIQNEEPFYQTDFTEWENSAEYEDVALENGKLTINSAAGSNSIAVSRLYSDQFAVQFDLRMAEEGTGACYFGVDNQLEDESRKSLGLGLHADGQMVLEYLTHPESYPVVTEKQSSYKPSETVTITAIFLPGYISVFIDGQPFFTTFNPYKPTIYTSQVFAAESMLGCEYDDFKIWDLSGMDPAVKIALTAIQSEEPLYQTSFDSWDARWNGRAAEVENGKLILSSENQEGATVDIYNLNSDRYAIEYELSVREAGIEGHCVGENNGENNGENRSLSFVFFGDGQTALNKSFSDIAFGSYDETQPNKVTLLVLGDQLTAFVNGQISYFALDPEGGVSYESQALSAYNKIVCEIDNYKIWDLSRVDFSAATSTTGPRSSFASILASIADKTPDYEDDFSNLASGWPTDRNSTGSEIGYQDGAYLISAKNGCYGPELPTNRVFSDFVLETDIRFINHGEGAISLFFRGNDIAHYAANLSPLGWFYFHKNVNNIHIDLLGTEVPESSFQAWDDSKHLTLIARQNRMALYVNGQLVIALTDTSSSQGGITFAVCNDNDGNPLQVLIDNLKIWDITDGSP